jgi:hypothetical protein
MLAAFSAFFLIRPFLDAAPAYRPRPPGTTYAYSFLVVAAFVPYTLAVWATRRGVPVLWAVAGTAVLHGLVLPAALTQSQDLYAYLFYGKMWAVHGANPYVDLPLRFTADPWFPWMRWPDQVSVYGPLWTMVTGGVARAAGQNLGAAFALTKAVVLALGLASVSGIVHAARARGVDPGRALLLGAWNPVVIVSLPLGAHADVVLVAAFAWAAYAHHRGRPLLVALLLSLATLVKAYAGVVLLVYLLALARKRRGAVRATLMAGGLGAAAYAPFWAGWDTFGGLVDVGSKASASLAGNVQLLLAGIVPDPVAVWSVRAASLAFIAAVLTITARRSAFGDDPWPAAAAVFAAYLAATPWFLYWHQAGLLALCALAASPALRAAAFTFSGTSMITASFGATAWGRVLQTMLRYGIPAAAFTWAGHRAGAPAPPRSPPLHPRPAGTPGGPAR